MHVHLCSVSGNLSDKFAPVRYPCDWVREAWREATGSEQCLSRTSRAGDDDPFMLRESGLSTCYNLNLVVAQFHLNALLCQLLEAPLNR